MTDHTGRAIGRKFLGIDTKEFSNAYHDGESGGIKGVLSLFGKEKKLEDIFDIKKIDDYKRAVERSNGALVDFEKYTKNTNTATKELIINANGATISQEDMTNAAAKYTLGAKAAQFGTKFLTASLNTLIAVGAAVAISLIVKGLDQIINKQKYLAQAAQAAQKEIESQRSALVSAKETIDSIGEDYERLAKGVDETGANISLSAEEYSRYHEITSKIAAMFPEMIAGYDAEGRALIAQKGNIEVLTKAHQELQQAYADSLLYNSAAVYKDFDESVRESSRFSKDSSIEERIDAHKRLLALAEDYDAYYSFGLGIALDNKSLSASEYSILKDLGISLFEDFGPEGFEKYQKYIGALSASLRKEERELTKAVAVLKPTIKAEIEIDEDYKSLDSDSKNIVNAIINNLSDDLYLSMPSSDIAGFILENLIAEFKGERGKQVNDAFLAMFELTKLFENGEITYGELFSAQSNLTHGISSWDNNAKSAARNLFKTTLPDTDIDTGTAINHVMEKVDSDSKSKIKDLNITDLQIAYDIKVPEGTKLSMEQLLRQIEKYKTVAKDGTMPEKLKQFYDSSACEKLRESMNGVKDSSEITSDFILDLAKNSKFLQYLMDDLGFSADYVAAAFRNVADGKDGFGRLNESALLISKVLGGMRSEYASVSKAKAEYDKAMSYGDYNTDYLDKADAYKIAKDGLKNGEFGNRVKESLKFLYGEQVYDWSYDEASARIKKDRVVFDDPSTNGAGIVHPLYDLQKKGALKEFNSSIEQGADGNYIFHFDPSEYKKLAKALDFTNETFLALVETSKMFGISVEYEMQGMEEAIRKVGFSVEDTEGKCYVAKQTMKQLFEDMGFSGEEVYKMLKALGENDNTTVIDFKVENMEELETVYQQLTDIGMFKVDEQTGAINIDVLARGAIEQLGLTKEKVNEFLVWWAEANPNITFSTDIPGSILKLNDAIERVNEQDFDETKSGLLKVGKDSKDATTRVGDLAKEIKDLSNNNMSITRKGIQGIGKDADTAKTKVNELTDAIAGINNTPNRPFRITIPIIPYKNRAIDPFTGEIVEPDYYSSGKSYANGTLEPRRFESYQKSLVGELAPEIMVDPHKGTYQVYGQHGAELVDVPKDAIIFNGEQTKQILKNGHTNSRGKAFANGTGQAFATGTSGADEIRKEVKKTKELNFLKKAAKKAKDSAKDSAKDKSKDLKEFDWIQQAIDAINKKRESVKRIIDDETKSYHEQISALQELIALEGELVRTTQMATETRLKRWEEVSAEILKMFGAEKGNELLGKISIGDVSFEGSIDKLSEKEADLISKAVNLHKDWVSSENEVETAIKARTDAIRKQYELRMAELSSYMDKADSKLSEAQAKLSMKETIGREVTQSDYEGLIRLSEQQVGLYYQQISALNEQLDVVDSFSAEYYNIQASIARCESAILSAEQSQAEWNEEIKRLPIKRIERYLELLGDIKQDLQNFIDVQTTVGVTTTKDQYQQLLDISGEQISKLVEQQKELQNLLKNYQYNSDKYNSTSTELQGIDNEISSLIKSQYEWNNAILLIPVSSLEKVNETLQSINGSMGEIMSDYDTIVSTIIDTVSREIETMNELKKSTTDYYDDLIDPLKEHLDLLQKTNKELNLKLALEKAQYDLERARSQKNIAVIRNGELVYEADSDKIRSAKDSLKDAEYNKTIYDLEQEIVSLGESRDAILDGYDDQIEKLDTIQKKWSELIRDIKYAADILKVTEMYGKGWQEKVLGGEDSDMHESMKTLYSSIYNQQESYQEQIRSNERIADMMSRFIQKFQDGSITYEEAISGIRNLVSSMEGGYRNLEHLNALVKLNGSSSLNSLLTSMESSAAASVHQFQNYLHVAKTNSDSIGKYTSTWEEMQHLIRKQIEELKRLYEENLKKKSSVKVRSSSKDSESDSNPKTMTLLDGRVYSYDTKTWYSNHSDYEYIEKKHSGILSGAVGSKTSQGKALEALQRLSTEDLHPEEVPILAKEGEVVLTPDQQWQLIDNYPVLTAPDYYSKSMFGYSNLFAPQKTQPRIINITLGDTILPEVKNSDEFAKALGQRFPLIMSREMARYHD